MVTYCFSPRDERPILMGSQTCTLRQPRSGRYEHARVGDELQLYGSRPRGPGLCFGYAVCTERRPVQLVPRRRCGGESQVWLGENGESWSRLGPDGQGWLTRVTGPGNLARFALACGFARVSDLYQRWLSDPWDVRLELIGWGQTVVPAQSAPLLNPALLPVNPVALPEEEREERVA